MADSSRARSAAGLFAGVAVSAMGYTMMVAVIPLTAEDLLRSPRWSGAPSALATTGVAVGTVWLSRLIVRHGRRLALAWGYLAAGAMALVAAVAAAYGLFALLAAAIFCVGGGYSASRLSRYAAADLYEPARRSAAIGWNIWAATAGAVAGPLFLSATERASSRLGLAPIAGPFLVAAIAFGISGLALFVAYAPARPLHGPPAPVAPPDHTAAPTALRLAVASLVIGQVVMVLIMTMTPIHIRHGGHGLDSIGVVFASHTFGMFAFSPVAGVLSDRLGRVPMILAASAVLVAAGLLAATSDTGSPVLAVALFLLGLGWCFSFVAASALLTESAPLARLVRIQGIADSLVWGSAAVAGLSSGLLLFAVGYPALSYTGAALAVVPVFFVRRAR